MRPTILVAGLSAAAFGCSIASPTGAQSWQEIEARYSATYTACIEAEDAASGEQAGLASCSEAELGVQEAALAALVSSARERLSAEQFKALQRKQDQWLQEQDAKCEEEAQCVVGEATQRLARADCRLDEIVRRTIWMENYAP